jgi:hypothetical protein
VRAGGSHRTRSALRAGSVRGADHDEVLALGLEDERANAREAAPAEVVVERDGVAAEATLAAAWPVDEERGVEVAARAGAGDVEGHDGAFTRAEEVAVELQVLREFTSDRGLVAEWAPIHDAVADVGFAVFQRWLDE